ncbi:MAG: peptidoglycan DD-metalloendopeptidase family protein [Chitinophagaceae bacterium]|nr:peptidoglycan DD-metalloendopeptidase family protein [Chitinophagaceae bacterium]
MSAQKEVISTLETYQAFFHPVVPFHSNTDILLPLDFTAANEELTNTILEDTGSFVAYIDKKLKTAEARYGIGGYAEHRTVYRVSRVFDGEHPGDEPRRLHLGTDIWGQAGTLVMAPIDAVVHSFAFNDQAGDYGATIILTHQLAQVTFHTLYGHLSLDSIQHLREGGLINKGQPFAAFGIPAENGHWPPHLHFQLIIDIGSRKGDYPGVCKFSEKELYLANSPDPDLILQLNQFI